MILSLVVTGLCAAAKTTSKRHRSGHSTRSHSARRSVPATPTPQRYQEIQQALASRGYYKGEANGTWDTESVDALKRFQTDQNLPPDGKLTSLSLIAMGLGPKRAANSSSTPPAPTAAPAPVQSNPTPAPQEPAAAAPH